MSISAIAATLRVAPKSRPPSGILRSYFDFYVDSASNRGAYLDYVSLSDGTHGFDIQLFDRNDQAKIETDLHLDDGGFTTTNYMIAMPVQKIGVRHIAHTGPSRRCVAERRQAHAA